jgi:hypothetical protein
MDCTDVQKKRINKTRRGEKEKEKCREGGGKGIIKKYII